MEEHKLDPLDFAIEQATMKIFAQAEQRRRLAKKNEVVYTRRERDQELRERQARIAEQKFNEVRVIATATVSQLSSTVSSRSSNVSFVRDRHGMKHEKSGSRTGVTLPIMAALRKRDGWDLNCEHPKLLPRRLESQKVRGALQLPSTSP